VWNEQSEDRPPPGADSFGRCHSAVSISTSNFDAELGRAGGAVSNVTLKSGANDIHGSVFGFGNNEQHAATDYFSGTKAPTHYRQFGATIGGPIKKNNFSTSVTTSTRDELGIVNRLTFHIRRGLVETSGTLRLKFMIPQPKSGWHGPAAN